jgi:serine O-acetyltransferase
MGEEKRTDDSQELINRVVDALCDEVSYREIARQKPMPSLEVLSEIIELLRAVIFPGYFGFPDLKPATRRYHTGARLDRIMQLLAATAFLGDLPGIRDLLATDVRAAYEGDPAAKTPGEAIFCYPSVRALTNFRVAHRLGLLGAQLIPRIITELAHSQTGIDIHPGAAIGERFFMDHGTGIVIGETCIIGRNVRIYQGVTLGAKSFPLDDRGRPVKDIPRHPIVEDDVIIYSGATILGRITIGRGAVIGGNVWITQDVPPGAKVTQ